MRMTSDWPSEGVPEGAAIVAATASAVTDTCVSLFALGVIVAADETDWTLGTIFADSVTLPLPSMRIRSAVTLAALVVLKER